MAQLFFDPDKTFDQNLAEAPWLEEVAYQPPVGEPQFSLLGQKVHLPFGIASSAAVATSAQVKAGFDRSFDVITYKTVRSVPFPCNPFPNVIPIDIEGPVSLEQAAKGLILKDGWGANPSKYNITNSFGNGTDGPEVKIPDLKKAIAAKHDGQILIASVVGTIQDGFSEEDYWQDFAETAKLANVEGVAGVELNLSCPNVSGEGVVCYTHQADAEIVRRTKQAIGNTPLLIKIGYFSREQQELLEAIINDIHPYVHGVSAINTIPAAIRKKDGTPALGSESRLISGLSGPSIKWAGLDMVKRLDELRHDHGYDYEILGMGGVMTPEDYQEYREAGADAVQSVAGVIWNPNLAAEIKASPQLS